MSPLPPPDAVVRVAREDDAAAVTSVVLAFRDHLGSGRPRDGEAAGLVARALADPSSEICLAVSAEGDPLGYALTRFFLSIWAEGRDAHLDDLFVVEAARGRGIGHRLLGFALERAAARGALGVGLHTNERNVRAHALYRALGFVPVCEPRWEGGHEVYWHRALEPGS